MRYRSTHERSGNDWRYFIPGQKLQACQRWKWLLHRCPDYLQLWTWNIVEIQLAHTIVVFERCDDGIHAPIFVAIAAHDNRQQRPDIQRLPHWCSGFAVESLIEATRRPKNNISPFSAHVDQRVPRFDLFFILRVIEIKYF